MRMPLSEDDQRRLDEIEQSLTRDDPQFAARVNVQWRRRRRLLGAITCFAVGAVLLIAGLVTTHAVIVIGVIIAVAGLGAMVAAAGVLLYGPRRRP
jgi:predicted tellurium resistance membrane protein TerC